MKGLNDMSKRKIRLLADYVVRQIFDCVAVESKAKIKDKDLTLGQQIHTRGMAGMLNTVWIILCAICFGGVLKASGMLANIVSLVIPLTRTRVGLVASTVVSGIFFNATAADQFLSIMLNASMFGEIYKKEGYEPRLLSRSIEDSSTVMF